MDGSTYLLPSEDLTVTSTKNHNNLCPVHSCATCSFWFYAEREGQPEGQPKADSQSILVSLAQPFPTSRSLVTLLVTLLIWKKGCSDCLEFSECWLWEILGYAKVGLHVYAIYMSVTQDIETLAKECCCMCKTVEITVGLWNNWQYIVW